MKNKLENKCQVQPYAVFPKAGFNDFASLTGVVLTTTPFDKYFVCSSAGKCSFG